MFTIRRTTSDGLTLRITATAPSGSTGAADYGSVTTDNNTMTMQVGAFAHQTATLSISDLRSSVLGASATGVSASQGTINVASIDVTKGSGQGAQDAIKILDAAITQVSTTRASLGAFQTDVLQATVTNAMTAQQNITQSLSTIRDANVAQETLNFSKAQILQQTGIAMLAQANQAPSQLLTLFR